MTPYQSISNVILKRAWNRSASVVVSATRYTIKQKSCCVLFVAFFYVSVEVASGNELATSRYWNIFCNTGAGNQNTLTGGVPKLRNAVATLCFEEGDNFRNVTSKVTQPACQFGGSLAPAGEAIRKQGDGNTGDNASSRGNNSSHKHESYLYDEDESMGMNIVLLTVILVVCGGVFMVGMLIAIMFALSLAWLVEYLFKLSVKLFGLDDDSRLT